jgi:hypothetical protein
MIGLSLDRFRNSIARITGFLEIFEELDRIGSELKKAHDGFRGGGQSEKKIRGIEPPRRQERRGRREQDKLEVYKPKHDIKIIFFYYILFFFIP